MMFDEILLVKCGIFLLVSRKQIEDINQYGGRAVICLPSHRY